MTSADLRTFAAIVVLYDKHMAAANIDEVTRTAVKAAVMDEALETACNGASLRDLPGLMVEAAGLKRQAL